MVFSQHGLACKYGINFQIYKYIIYNWMQNFLIPGVTTANRARL